MSFSFVHAADLHLGSPFSGLDHLPDTIRQRIVRSDRVAVANMIDFAIHQSIDFLLLSGDVYDTTRPSLAVQLYLKKQLERLREHHIQVFIVHGNHDPVHDRGHVVEWPDNVHVFGSEQVERYTVPLERDEVSIYGISYGTARVTVNLARQFSKQDAGFAIGMLHTNVEGQHGHNNYAPCTIQDLVLSGMDYWALGHVHTRKVLSESPWIVYPGNLQGRHSAERGEKGFYYVRVEQQRVQEMTFQKACDVIWSEITTALEGVDDVQQLLDHLAAERQRLRESFAPHPVIVRCILTGQTSLVDLLVSAESRQELELVWQEEEAGQDMFVWPESLRFTGQPLIERSFWQQGEGVLSEVIRKTDELLEQRELRNHLFEEALASALGHARLQKYIPSWSEQEQREMIRAAENVLLARWLKEEEL